MRKPFLLILFLVFLSFLLFLFLRGPLSFIKKPAGLEISTNLPAKVMLNGRDQGTTPYQNLNLKPGQYTLKLLPQSDTNLSPWETQLTLHPKVTTIIHRNFSPQPSATFGYSLQLQKEPRSDKAFLSVISDPDKVNLAVDGTPRGFTPLSKLSLSPGSHQLSLTSPGFKPLTLDVQTIAGYNLLVNAQLAQEIILLEANTASSSATPSATTPSSSPSSAPTTSSSSSQSSLQRPYVVIKETGTGWLRVRNQPNTTTSEEIGKVNVGEKLKFIEANDTGWYKVIFEDKEGWISGRYAQLFK